MCWKHAKRLFSSTGRRRGRRSIRFVLTAFYTLSASTMLFLATGFLYRVTQRSMDRENDHSLADQIEVLRLILREKPSDAEVLESEIQSEGAARRFAKYYARVLDEAGGVLRETTEMKQLPLSPKVFPPPAPLEDLADEGLRWRSPDGNWFLLMSAWAQEGTTNQTARLIQVALEVTQGEALLTQYRRVLFLVLALGIICSAIVGAIIARKGMQPLAEITDAAQKVTASHLHERIVPARWPKELVDLAKAFDEMLDRLEESFTRLSQFSADLAHELRTPITNLMGEAEVALSRSRTSEEYRHVLESALEEYGRLARMIDSLLFLARADNAETKLQRASLDVATEVQGVLDFYSALAEEQQIQVKCQGTGTLNADRILFRRALTNLVSNALHYTPAGGTVTVAVATPAQKTVEIRVSDTGCGISQEHLPKVFDRFYRIDPARSRSTEGLGLGLSIVKSIMTLHGGEVSLQSEPSAGTTVTLRFPRGA
jgi:two-component system heavy metal sensor histidine kinase CusS